MTPKKLAKIKQRLKELRRSPRNIKLSEFESIACQLGRTRANVGKEPTYIRQSNPMLRPLTIPGHNTEAKVGTAISIIETLLSDADEWESELNEHETDES